MNIESSLGQRRAVIVVGPGGVGKTTTSCLIALAAARQGRRVALLSIDPAKRLAAALGLTLGGQLREVEIPEVSGKLYCGMLDQKHVFDLMVERYADTDEQAEKILEHPLYQAASQNMAGPLEYMALAQFADLYQDPTFDLVVLDTPPDTQALDFLSRPNILAGFVENKVITWLIKPFSFASRFGLAKAFSIGEKVMGGVAKVTGVSSLRLLSEFLVLMQDVINGFHVASQQILTILKDAETSFYIVAGSGSSSRRAVAGLTDELKNLSYTLDVAILNRCLPVDVAQEVKGGNPSNPLVRRLAAEEDMLHYLGGLSTQGQVGLVTIPESRSAPTSLPLLLKLSQEL